MDSRFESLNGCANSSTYLDPASFVPVYVIQ